MKMKQVMNYVIDIVTDLVMSIKELVMMAAGDIVVEFIDSASRYNIKVSEILVGIAGVIFAAIALVILKG